jgi:hypothetical protein
VSDPARLAREFEAYAQEELDLQGRLLSALRVQEDALFHGDLPAIRASVQRFDQELCRAPARAARRAELVRRAAAHFRVAPKTLSLASICSRLGADGERLARQAVELRAAAQAVASATRRLSALARMHVRLNGDLLDAVLHDGAAVSRDDQRCGALLDARA